MRLLLDTHAILWMIGDDPRLSLSARDHILSAAELFWSTASLWEIGIKLSLNRPDFRLRSGWSRLIPEEMTRNAIRKIELQPAHCEAIAKLPWHHRDPFDRLLVSQASQEKLAILSRDSAFDSYDIHRIW